MRKLDIFFANIFFLLHCLLGVFLLVGWLFPQIKLVYLSVLIIWLGCWVFLGYCPITKWEFSLRRKYDKSIDPKSETIKYYIYKFFNKNVPAKAIFIGGLVIFIILTILTLIY